MKNHQQLLFPYAYNILGSVEDAKDAVQDVLVKYVSLDKRHISNEIGYLTKSVINQSINIKNRAARIAAQEVWLPEPLSTASADNALNQEEIISYSLLVLFEKLSSKERAVFILKEAFDYTHQEIAEILDLRIENSRKLLSRAKTKLSEHRKDAPQNYAASTTSFLKRYVQSIQDRDLDRLEQMLAKDITLYADGGASIKVVRAFTHGSNSAIKILLYVFNTYQSTLKIKIAEINHQPALLFYRGGTLTNCQVFDIKDHQIRSIYSVIDPEKLRSIS